MLDVVYKIETLLNEKKLPKMQPTKQIVATEVGQTIFTNPFRFTVLPSGNFCEFIGGNGWIEIYKEDKRGLAKWNPFPSYYFKTNKKRMQLAKLTPDNLRCNAKHTPQEQSVLAFLKSYNTFKKNETVKKLLLTTSQI